MEEYQYNHIIFELSRTNEALKAIIKLLEFTKTHHHIQMIPASRPYIYKGGNLIPAAEDTGNFCNCGDHRTGELTGGWICPVHGQCF